ncbi:hypothetical protein ACOMHN_044114 [Nucella lapillus]
MSSSLPTCAIPAHRRAFFLLVFIVLFCGTSSRKVPVVGLSDGAEEGNKTDGSPPPAKNLSSPHGNAGAVSGMTNAAGNVSSRSKLLWAIRDGGGGGGGSEDAPPPSDAHIQADDPERGISSTSSAVTAESASRDPQGKARYGGTANWLPPGGITHDRSVNLAVLPMLALFFFVFGVCVRCYSWMRDQDRSKARGQLDFEDVDEVNYGIITAGEQGYREVDLRSDSTSMYDTVTSFRSFRLPFNEHTVTSVKSLPNQPYETFRCIVLQKADEGVYDSVQSYKAFLEKSISEVDIEVELVDDYTPRPRSKSYDQSLVQPCQDALRSKQRHHHRRLRHHSGGRGLEGGVKTQAERERCRRHSDKSTPHPPPHPDSVRGKTFHRRSSPAILEPLLQGTEFKIPLEQSDEEEEEEGGVRGSQSPLERQSSNSSSTGHSDSSSRGSSHPHHHHHHHQHHHRHRGGEPSHRQRREKLRQKRAASQDLLAERAAKGSSHSSGHCSDDSAPSSESSKGSSSNELDSESDVTDSGLVVDLQKPAKQSCFKNSTSVDTSRSGSPGGCDPPEVAAKAAVSRKVHRFKVSFVDDTTLSAASE